jgi:IclR family acetate operon transcriptional repressor
MGKSVAAFTAADQPGSSNELARFTPKTIVSAEMLYRELAQVRARGWSMNDEELHMGVSGVGAPISGGDGRVVAAVAVAAPASVLVGSTLVDAVSAARESAARIGALLVHA